MKTLKATPILLALGALVFGAGCAFPDLTSTQQTGAASAVYGKINNIVLALTMFADNGSSDMDARTGYVRLEAGGETTIIDHHLTNIYTGSYAGWGATIDGVSYTGSGNFSADNTTGTWTYNAVFNLEGAGPVQRVAFSNAVISGGNTVASGSVVVNGVQIGGW